MNWFIGITIVTLASGWIGVGINELLGQPNSVDSLGSLIWLTTPFVLVVVARVTKQVSAPGRWSPRFKQAWKWYVIALLEYPAICVLSSVAGVGSGVATFNGIGLSALSGAVAVPFIAMFVKNICEESVWRGFFVGEVDRRASDWLVYAISGGVWGLWHVPYYLFFLPEEQMRTVMDVSRPVFALFACGVMVLWGVLFAELFRLAGSIWPLVLLHAVEDVTVNPLVMDGHLVIRPGFEWLISPVVGILPALCLFGLGLALRWYRINRVRGSEISPRSPSLPKVSERSEQGVAV